MEEVKAILMVWAPDVMVEVPVAGHASRAEAVAVTAELLVAALNVGWLLRPGSCSIQPTNSVREVARVRQRATEMFDGGVRTILYVGFRQTLNPIRIVVEGSCHVGWVGHCTTRPLQKQVRESYIMSR